MVVMPEAKTVQEISAEPASAPQVNVDQAVVDHSNVVQNSPLPSTQPVSQTVPEAMPETLPVTGVVHPVDEEHLAEAKAYTKSLLQGKPLD